MVTPTSISAYQGLDIRQACIPVIEAMLELGECSDKEIHIASGLEINQVTGRRNDLIKLGYAKHKGEKKQMGRNVMTWVLTPRVLEYIKDQAA